MSYILGAIFPYLMLLAGLFLLIVGFIEARSGFTRPGAILLAGFLIAFRIEQLKQSPKV